MIFHLKYLNRISWCIDPKSKKRKLSEPTQSKSVPQKRVAVGTGMSMKPVVKKETKPVAAVKDAKADFSFFSAPKPKARLPSFKKAAVPAQLKKDEANVSLPSSFDPFQEALKSMKARKDSPALSTPPAASASTPPQISLGKNGKKKKCVTWATDEQLVSIRLIERAIYDDDPVDVSTVSFSINDVLFIDFVYFRVRIFLLTTSAISTRKKALHCISDSSKRPLIGQNPTVSIFKKILMTKTDSFLSGRDAPRSRITIFARIRKYRETNARAKRTNSAWGCVHDTESDS